MPNPRRRRFPINEGPSRLAESFQSNTVEELKASQFGWLLRIGHLVSRAGIGHLVPRALSANLIAYRKKFKIVTQQLVIMFSRAFCATSVITYITGVHTTSTLYKRRVLLRALTMPRSLQHTTVLQHKRCQSCISCHVRYYVNNR